MADKYDLGSTRPNRLRDGFTLSAVKESPVFFYPIPGVATNLKYRILLVPLGN